MVNWTQLFNRNERQDSSKDEWAEYTEKSLQDFMKSEFMQSFAEDCSQMLKDEGNEFYESYDDQDIRKRNEEFFYTSKPKYGDPETTITLDVPYLCKYWDENAESTGKSGANIPVYRYADVLLMCAEAKATLDGGSTSDATAVDAYFQVRHRALPDEARPTSITVDQVLKERAWELCYEFTGWYDMLRTHRAFDPVSKQMVDLFGYQAVNHTYPFKESDLVFPVPLREKELNPLLGEDVVR